MGGKISKEEQQRSRDEVLATYPGLDAQLEMAFNCHDVDRAGYLTLDIVEPLIRHLMMQYGLIEYVARFSINGELNMSLIQQYGHVDGIDARWFGRERITLEGFKNLSIMWLKLAMDRYRDDCFEYEQDERLERERQAEEYSQALKKFEQEYENKQLLHQQALEEQKGLISKWNKILEDSQHNQQIALDEEEKLRNEIQEKTRLAAEEAENEEKRQMHLAIEQLIEQSRAKLPSQLTSVKHARASVFAYPAANCPLGACASAGAQEPIRRRIKPRYKQARLISLDSGC